MQQQEVIRSGRDRQRAETRERLYQAALDEIRQEGVANAQVDRIVAAVGVARGTFYFHFPTKEDVLLEWERRREGEIANLLKSMPDVDIPLRFVLAAVVASFTALEAAPSERRLLLETVAIHVRSMSDLDRFPLLGELERMVAKARDRGEVRDDIEPRELALLFLGNVFGYLIAHADPRLRQPSTDVLVDVFLSGIAKRA
jgi:TetR/AcrR family transcriptional repressor of uid operon